MEERTAKDAQYQEDAPEEERRKKTYEEERRRRWCTRQASIRIDIDKLSVSIILLPVKTEKSSNPLLFFLSFLLFLLPDVYKKSEINLTVSV